MPDDDTRSSGHGSSSVPTGGRKRGDPGLLGECRAGFAWWERFAASRSGLALMAVWAFAEPIVWPVIPDFLLVPLAVGNRRRFYVPLAMAALGSALGGSLLVIFSSFFPGRSLDFLSISPLTSAGQIREARAQLSAHHAGAFVGQPWSGIPFRIYGALVGVEGVDTWRAIPAFVIARTLRMAFFATVARCLAGAFTRFFRDFSLPILLVYLVLFFYSWWHVVA